MRAPRGQNLTLLALTTLLIALMVVTTLGISQRIRENHELNNLADAAAYTSAVVNARAFNNVAILNRLQVAYWVSMAANESLISWTGYARSMWNASYRGLRCINVSLRHPQTPTGIPPPPGSACRALFNDSSAVASAMKNRYVNFYGGGAWQSMDDLAGDETRDIQNVIGALRAQTRDVSTGPGSPVRDLLFQERRNQDIAKAIVLRSGVPGITVVPGGASAISARETGDFGITNIQECGGLQTGLCLNHEWSRTLVFAATGSRGNPFTTARTQTPPLIAGLWAEFATRNDSRFTWASTGKMGSAYWGGAMDHGAVPDATFAWGDDHGGVTTGARYDGPLGSCSPPPRAQDISTAFVKSTDLLDTGDQHWWWSDTTNSCGTGMVAEAKDPEPDKHHTVGDCTPFCPSVWIRPVGFRPSLGDPADAYGQPKAVVMLVRDSAALGVTHQPWKLHFDFKFSAAGSLFDNRGEALHGPSLGSGLVINSQGALATGMTYYHRKDAWLEHPNLLNPYWRATLVSADVDRGGMGGVNDTDVYDALSSRPTERWQGDANDSLVTMGYRGLH